MHTPDVPKSYLRALAAAGWVCREVEYLSKVAWALFKNWQNSRFIDVFTKLRVLEQEDFEKVLFLDLDLLVRDGGESLAKLFQLRAPAAMKRGPPIPDHGARVPYGLIWGHPTRRKGDELPQHQQASGINAGVMLLRPDKAILHEMDSEVHDYDHPQHYGTFMPEQEYISRFYGTFDQWTHMSCNFNFEIDKNERTKGRIQPVRSAWLIVFQSFVWIALDIIGLYEFAFFIIGLFFISKELCARRIPHDFTDAHEEIRNGGSVGHSGAVILHFSGCGVKPWDLLFTEQSEVLRVRNPEEILQLYQELVKEGPKDRLEGYQDQGRTLRLNEKRTILDVSYFLYP